MKNRTHGFKSLVGRYKLVLALFLCAFKLQAQYLEGGVLLGVANYMGDLSGSHVPALHGIHIDPTQTKPAFGILVRYVMDERWALKGYFGYGRISGADTSLTFDPKYYRNLSFYSDIFELSGQVEYNLIKMNHRYYAKHPVVPYAFAGIGVYNFNPKAELNGLVYELQPLATEGQGSTVYNDKDKYALTQICIPFGMGLKKQLGRRWTIGVEVGARYTFTNYLDDVGGTYANNSVIRTSTGEVAALMADRSYQYYDGNPQYIEGDKRSDKKIKINDLYWFSGITVTFRFKGKAVCPRIY